MVVSICLDPKFDVNTIITLSVDLPNGTKRNLLVNDYNLDSNPNYIKALTNDNKRDLNLCLTTLNKNDIWHKRKVFIQLYWLLNSLNEEFKISEIHLNDGLCYAHINNIFYSDGERNFRLFTSPIYNINRIVGSFILSCPEIKVKGNRKYFPTINQYFREVCFMILSFLFFLKIFFLKIKIIRNKSSNIIAISRAYAHIIYFKKFIKSNLIISENYSFGSLFRNIFSVHFWKVLLYFFNTTRKNLYIGNLSIEPYANYSKLELLTKYLQSSPMSILYLANNLDNKNRHIISAELLTAHSSILHFFAKKTESKLTIVQTVSLLKTNNFYFNYCDNFLFESFSIYKWFYKKHNKQKNYRYEGNVYTMEHNNIDKLEKIIYISQPSLKPEDLDYKIIDRVRLEKKIDIRLHPRDSKKRYDGLSVPKNRSFSISQYDLVITRTSSMAVQAIYQNIPVVYCLFDDWSTKNKHYYIPKNYFGIANDLNQLIKILENFEKLTKDFKNFRNNFFKENQKKDLKNLKKYFN